MGFPEGVRARVKGIGFFKSGTEISGKMSTWPAACVSIAICMSIPVMVMAGIIRRGGSTPKVVVGIVIVLSISVCIMVPLVRVAMRRFISIAWDCQGFVVRTGHPRVTQQWKWGQIDCISCQWEDVSPEHYAKYPDLEYVRYCVIFRNVDGSELILREHMFPLRRMFEFLEVVQLYRPEIRPEDRYFVVTGRE